MIIRTKDGKIFELHDEFVQKSTLLTNLVNVKWPIKFCNISSRTLNKIIDLCNGVKLKYTKKLLEAIQYLNIEYLIDKISFEMTEAFLNGKNLY